MAWAEKTYYITKQVMFFMPHFVRSYYRLSKIRFRWYSTHLRHIKGLQIIWNKCIDFENRLHFVSKLYNSLSFLRLKILAEMQFYKTTQKYWNCVCKCIHLINKISNRWAVTFSWNDFLESKLRKMDIKTAVSYLYSNKNNLPPIVLACTILLYWVYSVNPQWYLVLT